jgi:DNA repair protein RecO (recombination protein O)
MQNGCFSAQKSTQQIEDPKTISVFKSLLGTTFDKFSEVLVSSTDRKQLLELLMQYYQIHLQGFSRPKSLNILHEIYS